MIKINLSYKVTKFFTFFISNIETTSKKNQKEGVDALSKPPMDPDRQQYIDTVYVNWHELILSIQKEIRNL